MPSLSAERLSELIGAIYDCAIDPSRWPATMEAICSQLGFASSTILVADFRSNKLQHLAEWNLSARYQDMIRDKFAAESVEMFRIHTAHQPGIDEPMTLSRGPFERAAFRRSPMYLEWAQPQGYGDAINITVLREPDRVGTMALVQREIDGDVTDAQIAAARLLAPHVRRAVTIGDLINLRTLQAQALSATLDSFTVGVVLTNANAVILHANEAAQRMIGQGTPIHSSGGRLATAATSGSAELWRAIELAATAEANIGATGIGIKVAGDGHAVATAHVLPLARGPLRNRLLPGAGAAVFVTSADGRPPLGVEAVAQTFGLTKAEAQVLELLAEGQTLTQSAAELDIAETTARTHLMHIFSKTGVSRQADLIRLVLTLVPPVKSG